MKDVTLLRTWKAGTAGINDRRLLMLTDQTAPPLKIGGDKV